MKLKRAWVLVVVSVVAVVLLVPAAGCKKSQPQAQTGKEGGALVVGSPYGPTTFDPAYCAEQGGIDIIELVFDSLVTHDDKYEVMPRLAESWGEPAPARGPARGRRGRPRHRCACTGTGNGRAGRATPRDRWRGAAAIPDHPGARGAAGSRRLEVGAEPFPFGKGVRPRQRGTRSRRCAGQAWPPTDGDSASCFSSSRFTASGERVYGASRA